MTTERERQRIWKERHLKALEELGFRPSQFNRLRQLENQANYNAVLYCNGDIDGDEYEARKEATIKAVAKLQGGELPPGFFVNSDPRGYALKIDIDSLSMDVKLWIRGLHTDWGGYGILAPEEF